MGWTKEDKSFKKLIDKRGTSADFKFYEEFGDRTLDIQFSDVKTDPIPYNDPTAAVNANVAQGYGIGTEFVLIEDTDASANRNTWFTGIVAAGGPGNGTYAPGSNYDKVGDWISDKNGSNYNIRLFQGNGTEIFLTDPSNWIFDYPTGILTFGVGDTDNTVDGGFNPAWVTPLKITGYRYTGLFGQGGGGGDASFAIPINQTGIGSAVSVDDVIALPDNGIYTLANATDDEKVGIGIVTKIIDANNIEYQDTGVADYLTGGLTKGYTYYLDVVNGGVTSVQPADYIQPVFVALDTNKILINIEPMFVYETIPNNVSYPNLQIRVSADHGNDLTGAIGEYATPFETISAAVVYARGLINTTPALANNILIYVENGTYNTEPDMVFAGAIHCDPGVKIIAPIFDVSDANMSGLTNQIFQLRGNAALTSATFTHADETERHTMIIESDLLQFDAMTIASEFILKTQLMKVTNAATVYLVDSINVNVEKVYVEAGVSTYLFNINPATIPGTLENNSSTINITDIEIAPTGRLYLTNFIGTHEKHTFNVNVESAQGCAIFSRGRVSGDMTANFNYNVQFDNALSAEDHSQFETEDNGVINVNADITNFSYLNRGFRTGARGDSFINIDIRLVSYTSLRSVYIECFDNSTTTLNGTIDAYVTGSRVGIYVYAPREAPYDNVDNASNLYFQNVTLRQMNSQIGGFGLWCWSGAYHNINILGSYSLVGLWSIEKASQIFYTYNSILPISAEKTRQLLTATAGQSVFPSMWKMKDNTTNIFMDGFNLIGNGDDYSLTTNEVTLTQPADLDDEIMIEIFDAEPIIYELTEWATTGPVSSSSIVTPPISFITPPTDPVINAVLTGPDITGDGVKYNSIPNAEDPTAYLSYAIIEDPGKTVQAISVRWAARVEDALDSPVIIKIQLSNDNFVSAWESPEYEFSTESYVTREWYMSGRLFSPDKNTALGIQVRILIYHNVPGTAQGILFNNFKIKGYHK